MLGCKGVLGGVLESPEQVSARWKEEKDVFEVPGEGD